VIASQFLPSRTLTSHRLGFPGGGVRASGSRIVLGSPGRCPHEPTLVTMVFDDSGSVSTGNDPVGNRYAEARIAVEAIARRCRCHHEFAGIVHFDYPTSRCVPPTPLDRLGFPSIQDGLTIPMDGRGTSVLGPSLTRAYELVDQYPNHHHVLVVASDFELFDRDVSKVLAELRCFPGYVHAVVLRAEPPAVLADDDRVVVTRVGYDDEPGVVARAVFRSLTLHRRS
jgi:hypothetical protein